jgi:hypothetical protein
MIEIVVGIKSLDSAQSKSVIQRTKCASSWRFTKLGSQWKDYLYKQIHLVSCVYMVGFDLHT